VSQFVEYMHAFEAASKHVADCKPCQNDQPCEAGDPIVEDFVSKQNAWEGRSDG
jgi:hypothetical protein